MTKNISIRNYSMVIALVLIWSFFGFLSPDFLTPRNLSELIIDLSITGVLALGMFLILIPGQIDLSAGSGVGLIGGIASVLISLHGVPPILSLLIGFICGILLWTIMGWIIVKQEVPAFIITLGGLLIFKGLFWMVIQNSTISILNDGKENIYSALTTFNLNPEVGASLSLLGFLALVFFSIKNQKQKKSFGFETEDKEINFMKLFITGQLIFLFTLICNYSRGIPLSVVILILSVIFVYILTQFTVFGRYLYAIGGNSEASFLSGIKVDNILIGAYALMGFFVALSGYLQTSFIGSSTTTIGNLMELDAIAACVIGGTSLKGGRGTVSGVLFGALIMVSLLNGMTLLAVSPEMKFIIRGFVLALAVWMDIKLSKK
ncbi:MAG: ATPase [Candidatus Sericytochromatia bacterium]